MEQQLVIFELGAEKFGVEISAVESMLQPNASVLHAPSFMEEVAGLRKRLDLPGTEGSRIVLVSTGETGIGTPVDGAAEAVTHLESPAAIDPAFIRGLARVNGRLVTLLDLGAVFSTSGKSVLQDVPERVDPMPE
jgi:chemotaxis signal transduction protein